VTNLEWNESTGTIIMPNDVTIEVLSELLKVKKVLSYPVKMVDFSAVQQVDSAVLALLLVWSKNSTPQGGTENSFPPIQVLNAPDELLGLMRLYDLEEVILVKSLT